MAKLSELESQIAKAQMALESLQAEYEAAQQSEGGGLEEDPTADVGGQAEATPSSEDAAEIMAGGDQSFSEAVEDRMATPAEEVANSDPAPMVKQVMVGIDVSEAPEPEQIDMDSLYQMVYDETYDDNSSMSVSKMREMEEAISKDPRVKQMAIEEPEKFALYMYGRTSVVA